MAGNSSALVGDCIPPFLDASLFPQEGGFVSGRLCAPIEGLDGDPLCCLPCPTADWVYPDSFSTYNIVAEWLNVVGLMLMVFLLTSYIFLPAQKTRSHYLSVCLVVAVIMLCLGFTIPLAAQPDQCYNEITPNDMYSSMTCAWSGAFIIGGGMCAAMWVLVRALSMNLQICWDIVPGKKFFYASQALGWGIPGVLFTATMTVTGVSFRFGNECHVNHDNSMATFWGPLMAIAGLAGIIQLITLGYCIHVYLRNLWSDQPPTSTTGTGSNSALPSYNNSVRTQTARAVYRRLKKVLWLQWRGICIVSIILVDVIFFSTVFVYLDSQENTLSSDIEKLQPWLRCLGQYPEDNDECVDMVQGLLVNEGTVVAVLLLLSVAGFQVFIFLVRPSIMGAWKDFFQTRFGKRQEFVSLDAARPSVVRTNSKHELLRYERGHQSTTFEMQQPNSREPPAHVPGFDWDTKEFTCSPTQTVLSTPDETYRSPVTRTRNSPDFSTSHDTKFSLADSTHNTLNRSRFAAETTPEVRSAPISPPTTRHNHPPDYFSTHRQSQTGTHRTPWAASNTSSGRQSHDRVYKPPTSSFAQPKTPSRQSSVRSPGIDVRELRDAGYARGGLGLNPPSEVWEEESEGKGRWR
ncbi:hypothetical protein MBLNU230_g3795t1 [Neophaeotheca triangularis]